MRQFKLWKWKFSEVELTCTSTPGLPVAWASDLAQMQGWRRLGDENAGPIPGGACLF
jgi:hypothetical protein